jgi:putative oxidoreductase
MDQLTTAMQGALSLVARMLLAAVFVYSAVTSKIPQFSSTVDYMAREGVPNPKFALFGAIGLLLLGGLSIVLGAWTRIGAMFLLVFLGAATYYFHDYWTIADAALRQTQLIQFMKNLAIGGGLLSLVAFGGGPWSVDGWIGMKREEAESGGSASKPRVTAKPAERG